jgi:hypothetical protein
LRDQQQDGACSVCFSPISLSGHKGLRKHLFLTQRAQASPSANKYAQSHSGTLPRKIP